MFASHPALLKLPLSVYVSVHALVRAHMWTYAAERISPGAALRMSHVTHPQLLMALWDSDSRGRMCDDATDVRERFEFAGLMLQELRADRPGSYGLLDEVTDRSSVMPRAWRETFRTLVEGSLDNAGAVAAHLAAAERHSTGGSITYTIGLPGIGKSTWAREVWQPATGGTVLSNEGGRRRDRRAVAAAVLQQIPVLLAAGQDICIDATHLLRETRDVLVTYAVGTARTCTRFTSPRPLRCRCNDSPPAPAPRRCLPPRSGAWPPSCAGRLRTSIRPSPSSNRRRWGHGPREVPPHPASAQQPGCQLRR